MKLWVVVLGALAMGSVRRAQDGSAAVVGAPAQVTFAMDRAGAETPHLVIKVRQDGSGSYEATTSAPAASNPYGASASAAAEPVRQEVHLSEATTSRIFAAARAENLFRVTCQSKAKNIADTGHKTLSYEGPDGSGSCAYNYSEIKDVASLTELFLGMSYTMEEGRRLEFKHRYDRLGLFQEMDTLLAQAKAGRAPEIGLIAPVLQSLAGDGDLLERVRLRAGELLAMAQTPR